ncbi:MAG TPA: hypothetical protein VGM05_05110 [Planctomycetaceae bacterium]|jgi:hypothetical protein
MENGARFSDVPVAYEGLSEIVWRVQQGIPPLTEAEFVELGTWFAANEDRLAGLADSASLLDIGRGRKTCYCYSVAALRRGPRAEDVGESAEDIRQLRSRYADHPS